MSENPEEPASQLPAVIQQAAGKVPEKWRHKAAVWVFRLIAGANADTVRPIADAYNDMRGRAIFSEAVARGAAQKALDDPELLDRAILHFMSDELRAQSNREKVAQATLEELAQDPSDDAPHSAFDSVIDDTWFSKFDRIVADVSTDDMRQLLARILAGEIRRKGAFSLRTLRFVSEMDQDVALAFQRHASRVVGGAGIFTIPEQWGTGIAFKDIITMLDNGIVVERSPTSTYTCRTTARSRKIVELRGYTIELISNEAMPLPIIQLSKIGIELLPLLAGDADESVAKEIVDYLRHTLDESMTAKLYLGNFNRSGKRSTLSFIRPL